MHPFLEKDDFLSETSFRLLNVENASARNKLMCDEIKEKLSVHKFEQDRINVQLKNGLVRV